ncbi:hypothetical protein D1872_317450 [compost metagenome]
MQIQHLGQSCPQLFAMDDHVQLTVLQIELRRLKIIRQLLANRLLDHDPAGKTEYRAGFGDNDIAKHGEAGRNAPRCRVRNDRNVQAALLVQTG